MRRWVPRSAPHGMQEKAFESFKPWTADLTYSALKFLDAGYKQETGVEATITALAQAKGIRTEGLETAEFQISLFASLTDQEATEMLKEDLAEADQVEAVMDRLTRSWSSGDLADLAAYFAETTKDDPELQKKISPIATPPGSRRSRRSWASPAPISSLSAPAIWSARSPSSRCFRKPA